MFIMIDFDFCVFAVDATVAHECFLNDADGDV